MLKSVASSNPDAERSKAEYAAWRDKDKASFEALASGEDPQLLVADPEDHLPRPEACPVGAGAPPKSQRALYPRSLAGTVKHRSTVVLPRPGLEMRKCNLSQRKERRKTFGGLVLECIEADVCKYMQV